jgi:ATP-binding cassette subfamily B protein
MIYGGYRVVYTGATPGEFFSFMTAFLFAYEPAKRLARLNIDLNAALVAARILFEVIDAKSTEPDDGERLPLVPTRAQIEFTQVRFGYPTGQRVFENLSFVAEPEKVTALVGPSGGGKSTMRSSAARSRSTARTPRRCRGARCASRSPSSARTSSCSAPRSATTSRSASPAPPKPRSSLPPRRRMRMISS